MGSGKKGVEVQVALLTIDFTNLLREFLLPEPPSWRWAGLEIVIPRVEGLPQKFSVRVPLNFMLYLPS